MKGEQLPEKDDNYGYPEQEQSTIASEAGKQEAVGSTAPGITAKGEERFNSIGNAFTSRMGKIKSGLSRMWNGAKDLPKKAAIGVLSAPEIGGKVNEKVSTAVYDGFETAGEWANERIDDVSTWTKDTYESGKNFASEKATKLAQFAQSGIETAKVAGNAIKTKTVEGLTAAKNMITEDCQNLFNYGKDAMNSWRYTMLNLLAGHNLGMNAVKERQAKSDFEKLKVTADKDKYQAKLEKYTSKLESIQKKREQMGRVVELQEQFAGKQAA